MPGSMKSMIANAFMELCLKKNIDKITVKDLVEACGISRQTFYYHFQDLLDVVEWSVEKAVQQALALSLEADSLEGALEVFLRAAVNHREIIERMLRSQRRDHLEQIFVNGMEQYLKGIFYDYMAGKRIRPEDLEVAKCFYTYGCVGILLQHCSRKDLDVKRLSQQMAQLLRMQVDTDKD